MSASQAATGASNREECWPDWINKGSVVVDDVSRLNATAVSRVYQVRTLDDVQRILKIAKEKNQVVCMRGTKHSMGGHTMSIGAAVVDMAYVNAMVFHPDSSTVTVGTGAKWADLIQYLNKFGKAPRTLQSYCSFSVGGTLSVNGHGITTDYCLAESVVSFRLVKFDGSVIECSRESASEEARELFKCCIGGYGLFGVIFDVKLKVNDNVRLFMDTMMVPLADFPHIYRGLETADDIEVKLARINITNFDLSEIYVFRKFCDTPTVSNLGIKPLEMSNTSRLLYKWFAGPLREVRFAIEQQLGVALDWNEVVDRNLLLFESAEPLARLYSPLLLVDDTFILQEYFVPKANFNSWIEEAKKIVLKEINNEKVLTLLNITIRVVEQDTDSILPYSSAPGGSFAFVLYYRLRRTTEAIQRLAYYHNKLANITLAEGGTFYLPYQHHYSKEQLYEAYPGFDQFISLKQKYDPENRFSNLWWENYALDKKPSHMMYFQDPQASQEAQIDQNLEKVPSSPIEPAVASSSTIPSSPLKRSGKSSIKVVDLAIELPVKQLSSDELTALFNGVSQHRRDSFRKLMKDTQLRKEFLDVFLTEVLAIGNNTQIFRCINRAIWDPRLKDDDQIYMSLCDGLAAASGPITALVKAWKNVKQLSEQKAELVRETVSVLGRMGRYGKIHTMCSVGDHGKLVIRLRSALNMKGHVWVVHDKEGGEDDVGAILERGAQTPGVIGEYVPISYEHIKKDGREFAGIPDGVVDLVTMNQGLHHLPPESIIHFLKGVHRILKPGGLFITREHDLDDAKTLMPMLDCAHMVFNALTGVAPKEERDEIRGFRSVLEWRLLLESCGFKDSLIYEMQPNDPTKDIMLTFVKVGEGETMPSKVAKFSPSLVSKHSVKTLTDPLSDSIQLMNLPPELSNLGPNVALNQLPRLGLTAAKGTLQTLQQLLPSLQAFLEAAVAKVIPKDIPGLADSVSLIVKNYVGPALMMLARFEPLTEAAVPNSDFAASYLPEELFLLLQVLRSRSRQGGIFELAIISIIDRVASKFLDKKEEKPKLPKGDSSTSVSENASIAAIAEAAEVSAAEVLAEMTLLLETFPELKDLHAVVRGLGLTSSASNLVISMTPPGGDAETFTTWIVKRLDKVSWKAFKEGARAARQEGKLPTMDLMKTTGSGWNRAMLGLLSSPHIQIARSHRFMASMVGLGDLITLWSKAQEMREKNVESRPNNRLPSPAVETLNEICPVLHWEGSGVLNNVLHVVSARFVKKSLTGIFKAKHQDVTESAQCALRPDGTLDTDDISLDRTALLGDAKFVIEYRALPDVLSSTSSVRKIGTQLGQLLSSSGHLDGNLNLEHETLTWFKLSEWMQVEIVQMFGDSMNHTPWYRFPFIEIFKIYFQVLFKIVGVVAEKNGFMSALFDKGFLIDAIPGVVMGLLFSQMQLLALPLKSSLGDSYDASKLVEQLLVMVPSKPSWVHVDRRIVPLTEFDQGLAVLQVPTFKPFTEILINIATNVPSAILLQISNHAVVHVKMEVDSTKRPEEVIKQFGLVKGVTNNFDFKFPSVCSNPDATSSASEYPTATMTPPIYVSLTVQVPALFNFIRKVKQSWPTTKIYQIYDFF